MQITDIVKWNKRVSLIYAVGVWTLMGTYGFYTYTGHYDKKPEILTETKKDEEELPNPNQEVYSTAHSTTTIVYRENFVPYTTRIRNLIKYVSGDSTSESQDSKK
ncbi:small integral membrane protein 26-like [Osmerus eperlanus]|uniref:small integral membrane protein 26-like n=1 Tax=Osmerus eperlanus TaxID=29151 RepID=UPI002E111DC5